MPILAGGNTDTGDGDDVLLGPFLGAGIFAGILGSARPLPALGRNRIRSRTARNKAR